MSQENEPGQTNAHPQHVFHIQIDRVHYDVQEEELTGEQLRHLPTAPIPADRDLFEVVPGHTDLKITDDEEVGMHDGLRFFTAPATINPGQPNAR